MNDQEKVKINWKVNLIGIGLFALGLILILVKANSTEYIDEAGILHENFYLLPLGFASMFAGFVTIVTNGMITLLKVLWRK